MHHQTMTYGSILKWTSTFPWLSLMTSKFLNSCSSEVLFHYSKELNRDQENECKMTKKHVEKV